MTALDGLRVVDLSESIAGQYCARLLAGFGAEVVMVEPPGGSIVRQMGPPGARGESIAFWHLNLDKRSVTLDLSTAPGEAALDRLCERSRLVLLPGRARLERLQERARNAVFCVVTAFGESGPYQHWRGSEMVHQALSGVMYQNGEGGRTPLHGCGERVSCVAGLAAYVASLAALRVGPGEVAEVDVLSTAASMGYNLISQQSYSGTYDRRDGPKRNPDIVLRCRDGWVIAFVYPYRWDAFCTVLGLHRLAAAAEFAGHVGRLQRWGQVLEAANAATTDVDADGLVARLQGAGVPATRCMEPADLAASPHLDARGFWRRVDGRRAMGAPFRLANAPWRTDAPLAGTDAP